MNPVLLSADVSLALTAVMAAAMLAHLWLARGEARLTHGLHAATAAGLFYLFGGRALGWDVLPRAALCVFYAGLLAVAALAVWRGRMRGAGVIEPAAMAYVFAPLDYWRPTASALLLIYFLLALIGWLQGTEAAAPESAEDHRPPLFTTKRVRGLREIAGAALAAALVYVFAMGVGRAPAPPPQEQAQPVAEPEQQTAETPSSETPSSEPSSSEQPPAPEAAPAPAPPTYMAKAGETLRSIAKKLYGKTDRLPALVAANPGVKASTKLKAGQIVNLPAGR